MKKIFYFALIALLCFCFACADRNLDKTIIVHYYDNDTYIKSENYVNEIVPFEYSKDNYTFNGWYLDQELSNPFDASNTSQYFTGYSLSLYAKMELNNLTINYYDNDTLVHTEEYQNGNSLYDYKKALHHFEGWYLDKDFTTPFEEANATTYFTNGILNLYAKIIPGITINYYDGNTLIQSIVYTEGSKLLEYNKDSYHFNGWYLDQGLTTLFTLDSLTSTLDETINLYAKMDIVKSVTISYFDNDVLIKNQKYEGNITLLDYNKPRYNFLGWFLDEELTIPYNEANLDQYLDLDYLSLYAKTVKLLIITVNYYDNDELIASNEYQDNITLLDYENDDYAFLGWYTDKLYENAFEEDNQSKYFKYDFINLYAKTEKLKKVSINYYDGEVLIENDVYIDTIDPLVYFKDGYIFKGWYLENTLETLFDATRTNKYFVLGQINLYAKMEQIMAELDIVVNGKLSETEYVINPLFTWNNIGDTAYTVTVKKGEEIIEQEEVNTTYYQIKQALLVDSEYDVSVVGKMSKKENNAHFKTIASYSNSVNSLTLANPYSDRMVIQRNMDNIINGNGPVKQLIALTMNDECYFTISDENGDFEITLPKHSASFTPVDIVIGNGINCSKKLTSVLFGDVYLFAGQSNMQWSTKDSDYTNDDMNYLVNSSIRFFCQDVTTSTTKQASVKNGRWFIPTAINCSNFSAIATITGALLGEELKEETPIGIITAYQGDTNIANWMGPEFYTGSCSTKYLHYNAMIYPLKSANLKGVVWYQGCNNSAAGCEYKDLLLDLFANYRSLFNNENLSFFVIGLACYDGDKGNNFDFSYVRESQALACSEDDNAYFISTCDNGDPTYIHPQAKHYICERVAKSISAVFYGKDYYKEGPSYKSHTVDGNTVIIELNNCDGLRNNGKIKGLYLAGSDGKYYEATATIVNNMIVASSNNVTSPVYIKYGFGKSPFVNIFNKDGFAITPFRTDNYNTNIDLFDYASIDAYYFHPDGSTMQLALNNGNLVITKANDGKTYGSVRLDKWGAIAYQPEGFEFTIIGTNSGASISFRAVEGDSYEIWGYKIKDDFTGEKTFTVSCGDFTVMYNKQNNKFEPQKISYVEIMVESNSGVSFELCGARFIEMERTKPMSFAISALSEGETNISISLSKALFASSYELVIKDGSNQVVHTIESTDNAFTVSKTLFTLGKPYYVYVTAKNELGSTASSNDGYVFYLKDDSKVVVCNFDFQNQAALDAYIASSMSVHAGLTCTLEENGVKIASAGQGWQQFIFKLDAGVGNGMTKLVFDADFTHYNGQVIMQLADTSYTTYQYTINLSEKNNGTFTIDFSQFLKNQTTPFTNQTLLWVMFNFNDNTGNGYILLDDVNLQK